MVDKEDVISISIFLSFFMIVVTIADGFFNAIRAIICGVTYGFTYAVLIFIFLLPLTPKFKEHLQWIVFSFIGMVIFAPIALQIGAIQSYEEVFMSVFVRSLVASFFIYVLFIFVCIRIFIKRIIDRIRK